MKTQKEIRHNKDEEVIPQKQKKRKEEEKVKSITLKDIKALQDGEGLTLQDGRAIVYAGGWQVATEGIETTDAKEAVKAINAYNGTCGIWYAEGVYYVDKSQRVETLEEALEIGRKHHQISVFGWAKAELVYC